MTRTTTHRMQQLTAALGAPRASVRLAAARGAGSLPAWACVDDRLVATLAPCSPTGARPDGSWVGSRCSPRPTS
jgi:hypothetical protein